MSERPLFIYHGDCFDGFTAAWIFWANEDRNAEFFPARYGDPPPNVDGRDVWVVDFSYPRDVLVRMNEDSNSMRVLDHHKTAEEALDGLDFCMFEKDRCGATMLWRYLYPSIDEPWLLAYVEDRDLWRLAMPASKEVSAWIASQPMTFEDWERLNLGGRDEAVEAGSHVLAYIHQYGTKALAEAIWREIAGYVVPVVNLPYMNCSEHVGRLAEENPQAPFAAGFFQRRDGMWQFSLRARKGFDVSNVAKGFGGGGHAGAAGFQVAELPWRD